MAYRFIDHTADVAADLTGSTIGDIFVSAAQALTETVEPVVTEFVTLEAASLVAAAPKRKQEIRSSGAFLVLYFLTPGLLISSEVLWAASKR